MCSGFNVWLGELSKEQLDQVLLAKVYLRLGWFRACGRENWSAYFEDWRAAHKDIGSENVLRHLVGGLAEPLDIKLGSLVLGDLSVLLLKNRVLSNKSLNESLLLVKVI